MIQDTGDIALTLLHVSYRVVIEKTVPLYMLIIDPRVVYMLIFHGHRNFGSVFTDVGTTLKNRPLRKEEGSYPRGLTLTKIIIL